MPYDLCRWSRLSDGLPVNISVLIPTRKRPQLLSAVITAFDHLESGQNEISYFIGFDEDDTETVEELKRMSISGDIFPTVYGQDVLTLGERWNILATEAAKTSAIFVCHPDDSLPLTQGWDCSIVKSAHQYPIFAWNDFVNPGMVGNMAFTKEWLDRFGYLHAPYFPYWFSDTWAQEIYRFTTGKDVPIIPHLCCGGRRGDTTNMVDLDFWWGFFNATRPLRVNLAGKKAGNADFEMTAKWVGEGRKRDFEMRELIPDMEKQMQRNEPLSEHRQRQLNLCRERAQQLLKDNGLELWGDKEGYKSPHKGIIVGCA